jgi:serine/threonine-protein kinase HipA
VILKPDIADPFRNVALSGLNELLCMRLATRVGITAAEAFWFSSAYAARRFDREVSRGRWRRLHQEDFAQVTGVPSAMKYSVQWKACFDLVATEAATPAAGRLELVDRLFFNLVLGNNDAHGKNFAFLRDASGTIGLAPAYDILSTAVYPSPSRQFAMKIGEAESIEELGPQAWSAFSRDAGIGLPFLRERGARMASAMEDSVKDLLDEVEATCPALRDDIYPSRRRQELFRRVAAVIADNARRLVTSLGRPPR